MLSMGGIKPHVPVLLYFNEKNSLKTLQMKKIQKTIKNSLTMRQTHMKKITQAWKAIQHQNENPVNQNF